MRLVTSDLCECNLKILRYIFISICCDCISSNGVKIKTEIYRPAAVSKNVLVCLGCRRYLTFMSQRPIFGLQI